jgi:hypothetical protein
MPTNARTSLTTLCLILTTAGIAPALVHDRTDGSPLAQREFSSPALDATPVNLLIDDLPRDVATASLLALDRLGVRPTDAILDSRGGRWRTLRPAMPLLPGTGVGNRLTWEALGTVMPADDESMKAAAWERLRGLVESRFVDLRIDVDELKPRVAVHDGGALIQVSADRVSGGLPVRGAGFSAVINHGNLVLVGAESWGDILVERVPTVQAERALEIVTAFVAPMTVTSLREDSTLTIVPSRVDGAFEVGHGYAHRLAWVVRPAIPGDIGQWEGLVDAHNGELLAFRDLNHYGTARNIKAGVYPVSYDGVGVDGTMVDGYPMPFADVAGGFADAGGNFAAAGVQTTTLSGRYINMQEFCGAISESGASDIDLEGTDGDVDCAVPPGHSVGDTAASRTGFYELNRINEIGRAQLPANTWLDGTLTAQMNINNTCNAFWTGTVVQFFLETFPCGNTGQIAGVFDHEWGHGMDDNDVSGNIPNSSQGGGEGMADIYTALRLHQPCIGRGFWIDGSLCGGYGDPCTPASGCSGVRSVDFMDRTSGVPHDLTWVRANCSGSPHCLGAAYAEMVWDLANRDLPTIYGMDGNTAFEVTTRLTFIGAGNATGWFDLSGPPPGGAGCGAGQGYNQYLAADDDDGDISNGTPHMTAIAAAFDRHEIGCTPANGGPTVQDSGCAGNPASAPVVTASATDMGASLSWGAVSGATSYNVYRTDGEHECNFGKALVGSTAGTSFVDSGLQNGRGYYYVVTPMGAGGPSCFGPASACATVGASDIFADGFESGDTSAWSNTVP